MKKKFTFLIAALMLLTMMVLPGNAVGQTVSVNDVLWTEPFQNGSTNSNFSATSSWSDYINPTTLVAADASSLAYTSSNAMASSGSAGSITTSNVWLNKNTTGYIQISGIKLYNTTKVKVIWDQAKSPVTVYYQFDGSGSFTSLSTCSSATAGYESTELTVTGHTTIALKFVRDSNNNNVRIDNLTLKATAVASSGPSISVSDVDLEWNAESGSFSPAPSVSNPVTGGLLTAATTSDWLSVSSTSPYGLTCTANPLNYPRTATVTFTYTYNNSKATVTQDATVTQSANPNGKGSLAEPFTISEAKTFIETLGVATATDDHYVKGIISQIDSYSSNQIQYWISTDGTTTDQLEVYNGKGIGGTNFTAIGNLQLGNQVTVKGKLKKFNSTYEFASGSSITSYISKSSLTELNYQYGSGPSAAQTINVGGAGLTTNLALSLGNNSDFEISTSENSGYGSSINLPPTSNVVASTPIYVRLQSEKNKGAYVGTITVSTSGTINKTVSLSGSVTNATHTIEQYSAPATAHGTITFSPASPVAEGAEVTLSAEPATGYNFTANSWVVYKYNSSEWIVDEDVTVSDNKLTMPEYNIKVDGTFTPKPTFAVNIADGITNGTVSASPASAYEGQTVTLTITPATNYALNSLTVTDASSNPVAMATSTTFVMPGKAVTVNAVFKLVVTDVINQSFTGVTGSTYTEWSNKGSNDARYAGQTSAGNNGNLVQLRATSPAGIVTTTSGGKAKKVKVTWSTASGTLDVYGSNRAYTGSASLYNINTDGTKIGSIVGGTSTELEINIDTVTYIGLRSNSGTIYLSSIEITWAPPTYTVTYDANGGTGTTTDPNSPYTKGQTVTVLSNGFTAPENKEFSNWNTEDDGTGWNYNPGGTFTMPNSNVTLYAQWIDHCTTLASPDDAIAVAAYQPGEDRIELGFVSSISYLGGCSITEYGFVYSTTNNEPEIDGEGCTQIEVGTSYTVVDTDFDATIESATLGATYYVRSYAINGAGTAYSDVASETIPASYPKWTISYSTNGHNEASTTVINQGNAIGTLVEPTSSYIPSGYTFIGWYNGDYATNTTAPTVVKTTDVPTSDMTLKAVFAISPDGDNDPYLEITIGNFTEISNDYNATYTHNYSEATIEAHGVFKNNSGIQMNSGKGTYIKNTTAMPGVITKFVMTWTETGRNSPTMYANTNSVASTSSTNLGTQSNTVTTQTINTSISNGYKYFYFDGTTVTGACYMSSFKIYYKRFYYSTSVTAPSAEQLPVDGSGKMTGNGAIPANSVYTLISPVTIPSGKTLTVNGVLGNNNPANLIIEEGGQLILANPQNIAVTAEKSIVNANSKAPKEHWYTISSSVHTGSNDYVTIGAETTVNLTASSYDMFAYDESSHTWLNQKDNGGATGFNKMNAGQGYMYRNSGNKLSFVGNANVGVVTIDLSYTSDLDMENLRGFNLIGNPYTHSIAKGSGKAIDNANLSIGCYVLSNSGTWATITDGNEIKPNQGVLVETSVAVDNFQIKDINYVAPGKYNNDNLKFIVENAEYSDAAYAWFDKGIGLTKINHRNDRAPMLYIPQDGHNYAIAIMSDDTKVFGLYFKAATMGQYTLSYKATGEYNYIHVIDRLTGEDVDMLLDDKYTFVATPNDQENRFIVKLGYTPDYSEGNNDIFAYQTGSEILVSGSGELQIYDVTGRQVMTATINGAESINVPAQGVYIFRLVGNDIKTQKIVVR